MISLFSMKNLRPAKKFLSDSVRRHWFVVGATVFVLGGFIADTADAQTNTPPVPAPSAPRQAARQLR